MNSPILKEKCPQQKLRHARNVVYKCKKVVFIRILSATNVPHWLHICTISAASIQSLTFLANYCLV